MPFIIIFLLRKPGQEDANSSKNSATHLHFSWGQSFSASAAEGGSWNHYVISDKSTEGQKELQKKLF